MSTAAASSRSRNDLQHWRLKDIYGKGHEELLKYKKERDARISQMEETMKNQAAEISKLGAEVLEIKR